MMQSKSLRQWRLKMIVYGLSPSVMMNGKLLRQSVQEDRGPRPKEKKEKERQGPTHSTTMNGTLLRGNVLGDKGPKKNKKISKRQKKGKANKRGPAKVNFSRQ